MKSDSSVNESWRISSRHMPEIKHTGLNAYPKSSKEAKKVYLKHCRPADKMNQYFGLALLLCYGWSQSQAVNTLISAVGGTANGQPCVFPFKYKSKWYLDCTSVDSSEGRLWCATTANYDEDKKWGYCTYNLIYTEDGNANGELCVFPFKYKSKWYSDCTSDGTSDGRLWCATTANYAKDKKWGFCKPNFSYAIGGTANGELCVFPFKYKSTWYPDCTDYESSSGHLWCSTTLDFDKDGKWGYCSSTSISAVGGKASGEPCVFPFKYRSKWYMGCTGDGTDDGRLWCATTADYDTDGTWGYCSCKLINTVDGNAKGLPCVFPFTYNSKSYSDCTGDASSDGRLWCATTPNYDKAKKWGYCLCKYGCKPDEAIHQNCNINKKVIYAVGGSSHGEPCVFPFTYKSKSYWDCTGEGTSEGRLWCATTADYDKDKKWGYCTRNLISAVGGNADGQPCVFPFKYNDKWYSYCTNDGISDARLWCATTEDYNKDQKWGYCSEIDTYNCEPTDDGISPKAKTCKTSPPNILQL